MHSLRTCLSGYQKKSEELLGDGLRFAYRHFPTVGPIRHSVRAAEAAEAAGAQLKFGTCTTNFSSTNMLGGF